MGIRLQKTSMGKNLMFSLTNRVAVITGGAGALGLAIAETLFSLGAHVTLLGRSLERMEKALLELDPDGKRSDCYACDVSDESSMAHVCNEIISTKSKVDILVTCAAAPAASGKLEDITMDQWRSVLSTDLDGVFLSCKTFGPLMIKQRYGRIVNLTSFHDVATYPFRTTYNAAKSGVEGFSRALAVEWGHYGITVNTVAPGPILTPRTRWFLSQDESNEAGMLSRTPAVRIGDLSDVSSTVAFLVSSEAKHVNAQQIVVDGGWTANAWWGSHADL
ncbi:MAG: SDR family oxidoreductase [Actinobacteria bacterium]|nr:SDR family oxidoreductase [Actinomycetota bacterium]